MYDSCRDEDAMLAFDELARAEGILPALESAHAVAHAMRVARERTCRSDHRRLSVRTR